MSHRVLLLWFMTTMMMMMMMILLFIGTTSTRATGLIATSQVYVAVHVVPTIRLQGNL